MQGQRLGTYQGTIFWARARNRPFQTIPLLSPQRLYLCPVTALWVTPNSENTSFVSS
ncbi:unnamed protein product [Staurois parvus]|uniref:Uncharacterized protein n=1 Tax=Staurois parvus TaxID=386267 RepID=A0ABN9EUZ6_9NEOB|nr:unnamed protein product [Staurois parvus]